MANRFTAGEWKLQGEDIVSDDFVSWIAKVNMDCYKFKHNADLIIAAPDIYEALKLYTLHQAGKKGHYCYECHEAINKALAKAEGSIC